MQTRLRGVYRARRKLASGKVVTYHYLRGFGALRPLPGDESEPFRPGTPAFQRSYNAAIDAPRTVRNAGTLKGGIDGFQRSAAFTGLAVRTKHDYSGHLSKIEAKFGAYPLDVLDDPKVRRRFLDWRDELARSSKRQADSTFAVLRLVLEWMRDRGDISHNHATRPKKVYRADRSDKLWLSPHAEAFRGAAGADIRLAFELALGTGQRKADLLKLPWTAYDGKRIRFRQGKKRRLVDMPVTRALRAVLDAAPRRAATILTGNGRPWHISPQGRASHFDHEWRKVAIEAGVDGLHFHDMRGTTCTELAEAGATPSEIAAMLGWTVTTVTKMLDTYQSMTAALSDNAVAKLEIRRNRIAKRAAK